MASWLHRFLNPHCQHCIDERREARVCESCETLKGQLAIANHQIEVLQRTIINPPEVIQEVGPPKQEFQVIKPRIVPWKVQQQMLEREDREKARALKTAGKPDAPASKSIEELEKELGVVDASE